MMIIQIWGGDGGLGLTQGLQGWASGWVTYAYEYMSVCYVFNEYSYHTQSDPAYSVTMESRARADLAHRRAGLGKRGIKRRGIKRRLDG